MEENLNTVSEVSNSNLTIKDESELFKRVELDETESEHLAAEPYSYWKSVFRVFIRRPSAIIGLSVFILLILGMIFIPLFVPEGYLEAHVSTDEANMGVNLAPSAYHWFGTDLIGRDLFFLCWVGLKKSLVLALISSAINIVVGTIVGLAWGFFRKLDPILIEIYNLVSNIPGLLLYMLLSVVLGAAFPQMAVEVKLIIALCITGWIGVALFIRNQTLIITNREYNVASKTLGTPAFRIMMRNLLPYILAVIITQLSLMIPGMISSEVSMSFFGVGLPSSTISIGAVLDLGRGNFLQYPWQLFAPAGTLAVVIFTFYLLGLALSDALDPRKHR